MAGEHNGAPRLPAATHAYSHQPQPPHRQPPSPATVQQPSPVTLTSPSTVEASPRPTPGPLLPNGNASHGAGAVEQPRMRASVACDRCRKSKTKCVNSGIDSVCKSCSSARQPQICIYTQNTAASTGVPPRRDSTADGDGPPKKRRKNLAPTTSITTILRDHIAPIRDPLDSPLLTSEVWQELFDIYEKHLAFDFPFFHRRTFLSSVRQHNVASSNPGAGPTSATSQIYYAPLLLGFLTWTGRHHPRLVEQHGNDPLATADYYAEATAKALPPNHLEDFTLERVQTHLLLGFHEWTRHDGERGFMRIGLAIRAAQHLRLNSVPDYFDENSSPKSGSEPLLSEKEQFILYEKKRRTFWSCCLMDRYLSVGLHRPMAIKREDILIQLPCSDNAFRDGRRVRTRQLGESDEAYERRRFEWQRLPKSQGYETKEAGPSSQYAHLDHMPSTNVKWEIGESEHDLVWYLPILELFVEIAKWSLNLGRRQEGTVPPWDPKNKFKKWDDMFQKMKRNLPPHLQLTSGNTEDRAWGRPEQYVQIHALYTLCTVYLYREYLPTAPWGHERPDGPLEKPRIEVPPPASQPNYWVDQAKAFCKDCRDFSDLLDAVQCGQSTKVIASPMVAFAAYSVGISMIYCQFFPNYDPDQLISMPKSHFTVVRYLATAVKRFKITFTWLRDIGEWREWYSEKRAEYKRNDGAVGDSPCSAASDGSRFGNTKDYEERFEMNHKQFGSTTKHALFNLEDLPRIFASIGFHENDADGVGSSRSTSVKHEKKDDYDRPPSHGTPMTLGGFTSVNSPAKFDQLENQRTLVDARSPSQEYPSAASSYYSPTLHYQTPSSTDIGKLSGFGPGYQTLPAIQGHEQNLHDREEHNERERHSRSFDARYSDAPPSTAEEKAANRAKMEREGQKSLAQSLNRPVTHAIGPLVFVGSDFIVDEMFGVES